MTIILIKYDKLSEYEESIECILKIFGIRNAEIHDSGNYPFGYYWSSSVLGLRIKIGWNEPDDITYSKYKTLMSVSSVGVGVDAGISDSFGRSLCLHLAKHGFDSAVYVGDPKLELLEEYEAQ